MAMNKEQITVLYNKSLNMLHKLSYQCACRCGRTEEDVFGQACLLFMEATKSFDPGREVAFSSYLYACVSKGLVHYGKNNELPVDTEHLPEQTDPGPDPRRAMMIKEWLHSLSKECREVAMIILNGPAEILNIPKHANPKEIRGALFTHLRFKRKWKRTQIWEAFTELKMKMDNI